MLIGGLGSAASRGGRMVPGRCTLRGTQRGEKVLEQGREVAGIGCSTVEVQVRADQDGDGAELVEPRRVGASSVGQLSFPRFGSERGYLPAELSQQLLTPAEMGPQVWIGEQEHAAGADHIVEQAPPGAVVDFGLDGEQAASGVVAVQARSEAR